MVTQKPISLKIDTKILEDLDAEVSLGWRKRNSHINEAIRLYLEALDLRRRVNCRSTQKEQQDLIEEFCRRWFPRAFAW